MPVSQSLDAVQSWNNHNISCLKQCNGLAIVYIAAELNELYDVPPTDDEASACTFNGFIVLQFSQTRMSPAPVSVSSGVAIKTEPE